MQKPNTKVLQSKSSNSAIAMKNVPKKDNKKSRSSGEFRSQVVKKRGVYVEKRSNYESGKEVENLPKKQPSARPEPKTSRLISSEPTIQPTSTATTQHPEQKAKYVQEEVKKPKYKSKVLYRAKNNDNTKLVTIQSTKEIIPTTSVISEDFRSNHTITNNFLKTTNQILNVKENNSINKFIKTEVNSGNIKLLEKKITIDNDPLTLVAEEPKRDEKKLYNFFVDLLETSFDAHNVGAVFEMPSASMISPVNSKKEFSIDEAVTNKLAIENKKLPTVKFVDITMDNHFKISTEEPLRERNINSKIIPKRLHQLPSTLKKKRRLKSSSFEFEKKRLLPVTHSSSSPPKQKLSETKKRKKNFLNSLIEELSRDDYAYEEPKSFFEALKVMAETKKQSGELIHFNYDNLSSEISVTDKYKCTFKRQKILAPTKKKVNSIKRDIQKLRASHPDNSFKNDVFKVTPTFSTTKMDFSDDSLQVVGYYYNASSKNQILDKIKPYSYNSISDIEMELGEAAF